MHCSPPVLPSPALLLQMYGQDLRPVAPPYNYAAVSVSNVVATFCQYEALKHVSFPMQVGGRVGRAGQQWDGCSGKGGRCRRTRPPRVAQRVPALHPNAPDPPACLPGPPPCPSPSPPPLQTLGKCAKMIPVMIWGTVIMKKVYGEPHACCDAG